MKFIKHAPTATRILDLHTFRFPGGEIGVKLNPQDLAFYQNKTAYTTLLARVQNSDDFFKLVLARDAIMRLDDTPLRLALPYVPYARQDRACCEGEPFSLKVFAQLINSLNFERVTVLDPHSHVVEGVFDRLKVLTQFDLIQKFDALKNRILAGVTFVSPDAGANKKTAELAGYFHHTEFIRADKLRDLQTGKIKETIVYADHLNGRDVIIADDICDGGRTFIELAKVLKIKGAGKVILYVTHGIFSQGLDPLIAGGIDEVFTTNAFTEHIDPRVTTLDIEPLLY